MRGLVPGEPLDANRLNLYKQRLANLRYYNAEEKTPQTRWIQTAAPPCGLIMAGASLAHVGLKAHWQTASVATVLKLAVMPLVVWVSGRWLFHLDPLWLTVATLNAAMPAGANVYLIAQLYRTGVGLATNAVVLSTGFSVLTL